MADSPKLPLDDREVGLIMKSQSDAGSSDASYQPYEESRVARLLEELLAQTEFARAPDASVRGPLAGLIRPGDRVVVKPNWVSHRNRSGAGLECLVTDGAVVGGVVELALRAKPSRVVVGDAPIQSCRMAQLLTATGCEALRQRYLLSGAPVEWQDFRRTIREENEAIDHARTGVRPEDDFVLFDLGTESLLEPISQDSKLFRVTMYNPDLMRKTHAPGRHQYLISRHVLDADVVINVPKLKCHKKAGVTGALKNLVGINGNKDYLPHHRRGGSRTGGDCYEGGNPFKFASEIFTDSANRRSGLTSRLFERMATMTYGVARVLGADRNMEGSWYGNDTVWRMSLDLNRILMYGRLDGSMADVPQRRLITITDALVAGEGEGPLAPTPMPLGVLSVASNPAAADYVHAHLMQFDWRKIPIIREAFGNFRYPIANFGPEQIEVTFNGSHHRQPWPQWSRRAFRPPEGWARHCELAPAAAVSR
jgi:uncharacterized protein (DUF362 family)